MRPDIYGLDEAYVRAMDAGLPRVAAGRVAALRLGRR